MIWTLISNFGGEILTALIALVGFFGFVFKSRRDAVKLDRAKNMEKDHEHADAIRDRISRNKSDTVRKLDDAGYRD